MAAFAGALYEANAHPLHLVLDEADLWAPQRPRPEGMTLLGLIEEIVRRGRVRGFIPWLITQRPAVVHKDVLSQADVLIMMKLTSSQDREAVGRWIEGQGDRADGRRILAELPRLPRGEGYVWAPSDAMLERVAFPAIRTYDSSRTPRRGEQVDTPGRLAEVDRSAQQKRCPIQRTCGSNATGGATHAGKRPAIGGNTAGEVNRRSRCTREGSRNGSAETPPQGHPGRSPRRAGILSRRPLRWHLPWRRRTAQARARGTVRVRPQPQQGRGPASGRGAAPMARAIRPEQGQPERQG
jgi:hypothetical protein